MEQSAFLKQSNNVEFQDVYYTVKERKHFIKVTGSRQILRGVSGSFRNGELSAIMGPSGAGKSSLLNAISGLRTSGIEGHMRIERKHSCYITQEDHHQTLLTVGELMNLSCSLKLKNCQRKVELITEILENLHLNHRRHVTAEKLSGGERKRLSIALELVANPTIFFLDEPTSGLDEVTAAQCIHLLKRLAREGRTIVCTIHQPSARVFNCFDNIFVLARGVCVYQGTPGGVIPFLRHVQIECPTHYSPADYIIEVCDSDHGKLIPELSNLIDNGKLIYSPQKRKHSKALLNTNNDKVINCDADNDGDVGDDESEKTPSEFYNSITTFFIEDSKRNGLHNLFSNGTVATDGSIIGGVTALYEHMKAFTKRLHTDRNEISGFYQFRVLIHVMMLRILRARIALFIQFAHHIMCGLFFGLIFLNLGNNGARMFDHLKFCVGVVLMIVYTQVMIPILSFPSEVKIVKKETFNRWYSLTPYYMALTISRIPLQVILNMIFLSMTYWMTGLPPQLWRFGLFSAVGLMSSLVAEGMGLAIGATFNITNGSAVGPLMIAPLMGLGIYGFDFAAQIPYFMNILMEMSYIRVGVMALVLSVFGFGRENLECNEIYCHFSDPNVLLRFVDIEKISILYLFMILGSLMLFYRALLFISLRSRCGT